MNNKS